MQNRTLTIVAAMGANGAIGLEGSMPWHLPSELAHFKRTTMGKPIVMGRKTWESIGRVLPGRQNIVVTRSMEYQAPGCTVAHSLTDAIKLAEGDEIMVIGGGELYSEAMPLAARMVLTTIDLEPEADTWFPAWNKDEWRLETRREVVANAPGELSFQVSEWVRLTPPF